MKEYRLVLKAMEKHQDRFTQRKIRQSKTLSERYTKDRVGREKSIRDSFDKYQHINNKTYLKVESDISLWTDELLNKIRMGECELVKYVCTVVQHDMSTFASQNEVTSISVSEPTLPPIHSFPQIKDLISKKAPLSVFDIPSTESTETRVPNITKWLACMQHQQEMKDKAFYNQNMMRNKKHHSQEDKQDDKQLQLQSPVVSPDSLDCRILIDELMDFFAFY